MARLFVRSNNKGRKQSANVHVHRSDEEEDEEEAPEGGVDDFGAASRVNRKRMRRRGDAMHACEKRKSHSLPIASSQACNTITVSAPPYKNDSGSDRKTT